MIEFAIVLPLVLLILVAVVEVAVVSRVQLQLVQAAREGARAAATSPDPADAVGAARQALGGDLGRRVRVAVRRPERVGGIALVRLSLSHRVAAPLFGGYSVELAARAAMRVER